MVEPRAAAHPTAEAFLARVGAQVLARRQQRGWSRRELAARAGLSERFLALLEAGTGNISLTRFAEVAAALELAPDELLRATASELPIALLGMRGAGKSTLGPLLAKQRGWRFFELDREIERLAGLRLAQIFELHGEAYYRRLEHQALRAIIDGSPCVFATGGSIVTDDANYELVLQRCTTVWLKATPKQHWERVVQQGDLRPMQNNPHAFAELRDMLARREPAYARARIHLQTARGVPAMVKQLATATAA
ncbi:MAG: helix-turn-helix domain-containing protein [Myxococcales bacterium]|nr:helix-turn-helix domain-containing protein [Myxococcales bacterium]